MIQKKNYKKIFPIILLAVTWLPLSGTAVAATDSDGDGILNIEDNCIEIANNNQRDSNGDGFGNVCDADLDNNGIVGVSDLGLFKSAFGTTDADADFDGNGVVSVADIAIFKMLFGKAPGPAGTGTGISEAEAARFLTQSTFGPTTAGIQHLVDQGKYENWLNEQFNMSPSFHIPLIKAPILDPETNDNTGQYGRMDAWWDVAVFGQDQLRQRVAFALSEILVISDVPEVIYNHRDTAAAYYDILVRHSFGNFRELLQDVTLSPAMGMYLNMLGNNKPDPSINRRADENYAREVMQLFTIGLEELNIDGTAKLDFAGKPIPTYDQSDVESLARIFTGWAWNLDYHSGSFWEWDWEEQYKILHQPMISFSEYHDQDEKLFLGEFFSAGQSAEQDLDNALDILFNHPNVGPFICKQLIMRLVTSNPSPDYISRVASIFNNNGQNVRGDLQAVVKAILLDQNARLSPSNHFGKLREPLLRITHLWRAFKATGGLATVDWLPDYIDYEGFHFFWPMDELSQAPLRSPSVFNFFRPNFSPAGKIKEAGLIAPEFQITSESRLQNLYATLIEFIFEGGYEGYVIAPLDLNVETALVDNPVQLIDHLDILLTSGSMSREMKQILLNYINTNKSSIDDNERLTRDLIILIMTSAEYSIQR